ncbi:hypothetical protein CLV51_104404 [Chitinophaga niastensis]|uniref:Uncharacterized protein n=1 Tax=Chitinophaga niastensis TaxID=536980 RepID=A0A2P8HHL8_CHINA|nr:hypothetical protein CLV51_104404 [Chitinophaga niastensis]
MKKERTMLAAIAVVAVISGGLAVKAKTWGARLFCSTKATCTCPVLLNKTTTTNINAPLSFCTTDPVGCCNFAVHVTVVQ